MSNAKFEEHLIELLKETRGVCKVTKAQLDLGRTEL